MQTAEAGPGFLTGSHRWDFPVSFFGGLGLVAALSGPHTAFSPELVSQCQEPGPLCCVIIYSLSSAWPTPSSPHSAAQKASFLGQQGESFGNLPLMSSVMTVPIGQVGRAHPAPSRVVVSFGGPSPLPWAQLTFTAGGGV